jgi:quercetin dioxygenase-like cupin family protein
MTTVRVHRWDEIALEKITEMISQKIVTGEREMLAQIYLKRGALVPMHSHESEQMTYILQGALRVVVDGEEMTVREGEVLHIPSGVPHQAEALEDTFELDVLVRSGWIGSRAKANDERARRTSLTSRSSARQIEPPARQHRPTFT